MSLSVLEMFDKVKGVNLFDLKSYMEKTEALSMNSFFVVINDLFVNLPMFFLNLVVGLFSILMKLFESLDLVTLYETYIYSSSYAMWRAFIGGGSFSSNSVVWLLFSCSFLYLVVRYLLVDNFSQRIIHLLAVLIIGFAYFGTIQSTSGGLYVLRGIRNFSREAVSLVSSMKVQISEKETISFTSNFSDTYIAETSYKAYLFVNTGRTDGNFLNAQKTGEEAKEKFDDSKVLGTSDSKGKFTAVKAKDRSEYLDKIGHGANEGEEKNRWVSAIFDYIPIRFFYILFKVVEAVIRALPVLLIYVISFMAQLVVLGLMLLIPFALVLSFIPSFQSLIFSVVKGLMVGSIVPSGLSIGLLMVFFLDKLISVGINSKIKDVVNEGTYVDYAVELFTLIISIVVSGFVYFGFWKYKGSIFRFLFGDQAGGMMDRVVPEYYTSKSRSRGKSSSIELDNSSVETAEAVERGVYQGLENFFADFDGGHGGEEPFLFEDKTETERSDTVPEDNREAAADSEETYDMTVDMDIYQNEDIDINNFNRKTTSSMHYGFDGSDGTYFDSPILDSDVQSFGHSDGPVFDQELSSDFDTSDIQGTFAQTLERMRGDY